MITNGFDSDSTDNTYMIAMTMMKALVLMMKMTPYNCVKGNNDSKKKKTVVRIRLSRLSIIRMIPNMINKLSE